MITDPADRERVIERIRRVNCKHCEAGVTLIYDPADTEYHHDVEIVLIDPLGVPVRARYRAWCTGSWAVDYYHKSGKVWFGRRSAGEST